MEKDGREPLESHVRHTVRMLVVPDASGVFPGETPELQALPPERPYEAIARGAVLMYPISSA